MGKKSKRRFTFLIIIGLLLVLGVSLLIGGSVLAGYDLVAMLTSHYAIWCYVAIGVVGLVFVVLEIQDAVNKM